MKDQKLPAKIFGFIAILSGIIWLGVYASRTLISYQLFDVKMNLMPFTSSQNLEGIFIAITPVINTTFVLYIIFIIAFTIFLFLSNIKLKQNGWLFIIVVIVYVTLPFEVYLMTIDYKLICELNYNEIVNAEYSAELLREGLIFFSGFPVIIFLSYCSLIYFLVFKPFYSAAKR
jgi:hypothetical protein